jgi:hypothetical protein
MNTLLISSIVLSIIAILLLGFTLFSKQNKEDLSLCDNLGNLMYKDVDMLNPYVVNYNYPSHW